MMDAMQQEEDKFARMDFSELVSRYAISFRDGHTDDYAEVYKEIMKRVQSLRDAQYKLKNVTL